MISLTLKDRSALLLAIAKEGKNVSDFAKEIGVSNGYLSQVLNGNRNPSAKTAYKIAAGIGANVEDIFSIGTGLQEENKIGEVN